MLLVVPHTPALSLQKLRLLNQVHLIKLLIIIGNLSLFCANFIILYLEAHLISADIFLGEYFICCYAFSTSVSQGIFIQYGFLLSGGDSPLGMSWSLNWSLNWSNACGWIL